MILSTYSAQFRPDYGASPADNVRRYIDGLPGGIPEPFEGLRFQKSVRDSFMGDNGKLDTEKVYREAIAGEKIEHEMSELMRYAIILKPTKRQWDGMIDRMLGSHVTGSCSHPIARSRNEQQWRKQARDTFGIPPTELDSGYPYQVRA